MVPWIETVEWDAAVTNLVTVRAYLESQGLAYPEPDSGDLISSQAFERAGLPMVVACAHCEMTMGLHADLQVDPATGRIYCGDCADAFHTPYEEDE